MLDSRDRALLSSESGLVSAGTVIGLAIAGFFLYLLLAAFEGDTDYYGNVPIPSSGVAVELPEDEIDVFYAEAIDSESGVSLTTPEDLSFSIVGAGESVRVDTRGGEQESTDTGTARVIGAAFVPEEGVYLVDVESTDLAQRVSPSISFGQSPVGAVKARFNEVIDELQGPTGIVVAAVLVILFLLPRVQRALARRE